MNEIQEKIERWKIKAKILLDENKKCFIKDSNNTYFFADILIIEDSKLYFKPFKGNNSGEEIDRYWADIISFNEYREVRG